MLEIIFHSFIFFIILFGNGLMFQKTFLKSKVLILNNFEISFLGFAITGFLAILFNFFISLNDYLIFINFIICLFFFWLYRHDLNFRTSKSSTLILIGIFILTLINIYGSGFSDDLNHYHGGYIINTDNSRYIIGSNYLHHHYGYSSIWLILQSYLNFNGSFLQDIHVVNGLIFFLIISYLLIEVINNRDKNNISYIVGSVILIFLLIKYTRLKEFGLDRPGIIFYCFLVFFSAKYQFIISNKFSENKLLIFFLLTICLFITTIKITLITSFIIPLVLILITKSFNFFDLKLNTIFIFLISIIFIKNLLISGCLIYPIDTTCINILPWSSEEIANNLLLITEASTKSHDKYQGILSISEYIERFNWFSTWLNRNLSELNDYFLTSLLVLFLFFISSKIKKKDENINVFKIIIILLFLANLIIFMKSPVIRYHHMLFITFIISLVFLTNKKFLLKTSIFQIVIILILSFNFSKNFFRIYTTNFFNDPYEHIKIVNWYRVPAEKKLNNFVYYKGWIDAHPVGNMELKNLKHIKRFGFDIIYK